LFNPEFVMAPISPETMLSVGPLLRQLRDIKLLRERQAGVFFLRTLAFVQFLEVDGVLCVELKKESGSAFDRFPLDTPAEQRHFIDEAKRRAARLDED
jgi:hypothetical protein